LPDQQKIEELGQKLSDLKEQKDKLNAEAGEHAGKRDKLNEQFNGLRTEISQLKSVRDEGNEKVKWLKQNRTDLKDKIHEKIEELNKLRQEVKTLVKDRPTRHYQILQKEFESLEWKIQTTSLNMQEEKELIKQVKQVETQLRVYKKTEQTNRKILDLRAELENLDAEGKSCHQKLTQIAQNSQEIHKKMLTKIEESKKIKAEANVSHQAFVQAMEKLRHLNDEVTSIWNEMRQLKAKIREEEAKGKKRTEETLRDTLERQAREKLKRREKLSWEEFQLLAEKGM